MRRLGLLVAVFLLAGATTASATHTTTPTSVTIAGSLQSELGCGGDWDPGCAATHLGYDADDDVWQGVFNVPAGGWEYKAAAEQLLGRELRAARAAERREHPAQPRPPPERQVLLRPQEPLGDRQRQLGDRRRARQLPVASSAARATGIPAACARGSRIPTATASTRSRPRRIPAGSYEAKVAINESWDENYGAGGVAGRGEHPVHRPRRRRDGRRSRYNSATHVLTISPGAATQPRRQRRVGRPAPRLARPALPHAGRRGPGRHVGDDPLPHVPRRRHVGEAAAATT